MAGILLTGLVVCASSGLAASEGFQHDLPRSLLDEGRGLWSAGEIGPGSARLTLAYLRAVEAGGRHTLASLLLGRVEHFTERGDPGRALDACTSAVSVLGPFDDASRTRYSCSILRIRQIIHDCVETCQPYCTLYGVICDL